MQLIKSSQFAKIVSLINQGKVGVMPTDTVYGLVCKATDKDAVKHLYEMKGRNNKPGTVIAADINQLVALGIKYMYLKSVEQFWPGQVSVIIPCPALSYLHLGKSGIAVRIPDQKSLIEILKNVGPLLTTSANHPGKPVATNVKEVQNYFGGRIDFFVDGGDLSGRLPSTVIRIIDDAVEVVREGAFKIET